MDLSVYIFDLLLDVFIVFTIFAIYLYVLFRFFIHTFEEEGLMKFFRIHLEFYKPLLQTYKNSYYNKQNPNAISDYLQSKYDYASELHDSTDYSIANYAILGGTLSLFLIVVIYFLIFRNKIMAHISMIEVLSKIAINAVFILVFELMFLFFVYGNTDLFNLQAILNVNRPDTKTQTTRPYQYQYYY